MGSSVSPPLVVVFLTLLLTTLHFFPCTAAGSTSPDVHHKKLAAGLVPHHAEEASGLESSSLDASIPVPPGILPAVQDAIQEFGRALSFVSTFVGLFGDLRLTSAIQDCVDLVDLSVDELNQVMDEMSKINGSSSLTYTDGATKPGPPPSSHNLKTWLSAASSNQDTCLEGFDGTDGSVKMLLQGSLLQVTDLVANILASIPNIPVGPTKRTNRRLLGNDGVERGFPAWLGRVDRSLLQAPASGMGPNAVVAKDGSGNFKTVMEAVQAAPSQSASRYTIYVKRGTYYENVDIKKKKTNIMLIGDGMDVTVISGNRNFVDGWTTFRSATFAVSGAGFIARDITFENTAGPGKHQAVAARVDSDLSVFYRVSFVGYQDTLYAHSLRQFYRECQIWGTVDFIFGNGQAVFQNCLIVARKPLPDQKNSVTAQGRKDPNQNTGFSIQFCNITGDSQLMQSLNGTNTYLGRPWKPYSRTVVMQSYLSSVVHPQGWLEWNGDFALSTLYYGEYLNYGPGAVVGARVKWPGFHVISDPALANNFTVAQFLDGNNWLPSTGVRYTAGLST